jgi:hypothetical protein
MQDKRKDKGLDIKAGDVLGPVSDSELKGRKQAELDPDELTRSDAVAEAVRENRDPYLVKTDLDDSDERGPTPDMKEQR